MATPVLDAVAARLAPHGLIARGAFHPADGDGVPDGPGGEAACTLVMVGNAGPAMWDAFTRSDEAGDGAPDPLDRWVTRVLVRVAAGFGAWPLFPFGGPPWLPFLTWAQRAEAVHPSPLGMLIHPDYGLWHAWRGALAFADRLDLPPPDDRPSPCATCVERPCLTACPVDAFSPAGYDVPACAGHIAGPASGSCVPLGCAARRACPAGRGFVYAPAQAEFHMRAFLGAQGGS